MSRPTWLEAQRDAIEDAQHRGDRAEVERLGQQARRYLARQRPGRPVTTPWWTPEEKK